MALIEKLTNIADAIRNKTGSTAEMTLDAMTEAIAGIEAGGGASGIYMAKITPAEYLGDLTITHNLGTTDILYVAAWAESFGDYDTSQDLGTICKYWAKTDIPTRRGGNGFSASYSWNNTNQYADTSSPNMGAYEKLSIVDENTVKLARAASGAVTGYYAGVTFTVFVIAANAEV